MEYNRNQTERQMMNNLFFSLFLMLKSNIFHDGGERYEKLIGN